jgi:competence protein ComEA
VAHSRGFTVHDRRVPELSRAQLIVYAAIAVALLLVGARWAKTADGDGGGEGVAEAARQVGETGGDSFAVDRGGDLVVHVAGAVREPGVYRMPAGSRVTDAVQRAGGPTAKATADAINLAAPLADGQQVQVPAAAVQSVATESTSTGEASGPISLGSATVPDLDTIEGIGPVTAAAILEYRDEHGGIASVDELDEISGIGPATMEALRGALQP